MIKELKKLAFGFALSGLSGIALAQSSTCDSAFYSTYYSSSSSQQAYMQANHPECFPSGADSSTIEINATSFAQALAASRSIASRFNLLSGGPIASTGTAGLAAGGMADKWNVWGSIDQNNTDFGYTAPGGSRTSGRNDVTTSIVGFDYALSPRMVAGVSLAFDRSDGSGTSGAPAATTSTSADGYQVAPYVGYQISKELAFDASIGMGEGDFSNSGGVKASADRWFAAANLTYAKWMGNMQYTGKASYLHGEEEYEDAKLAGATLAKTGSTNKIDQIRIGAQAGYWMNGVMPFAGLAYTADVSRSNTAPGSNQLGRDAFVWTLGVNFISLSSKLTGGVMYQVESNRSNADNDILTANINFRF